MKKLNFCFAPVEIREFAGGTRTNLQIKEYQKRYREAKKAKKINPPSPVLPPP